MAEAATRKEKVRYKFDALGRRVQRIVGGRENTKFIHDGLDVLVDDNGGTLTKYLNADGIDNKLRAQTGTSVNYFLSDHLGSTNGLVDASGTITSQTAYDSFGNQTASLATRYRFTGRERDDLSGLMHYRARFYDPKLGRFTSEDPIGLAGGINPFAYVYNNPLRFTDSLGLDAEWDERVWRAQQDLINAAAPYIEFGVGFGDNILFDGSKYFRQWQGIDDPSLECSVWYQAGGWTSTAIQTAAGGVGLYRGGVSLFRWAAARQGARNFFNGTSYSPKVFRQMANTADEFHAFPESVAGYATRYGKYSVEIGADGTKYEWLRMAGSYRNHSGIFEFVKDSRGIINHRYLNTNGF